MPLTLLYVFLGGGIGSVCRFLLSWLMTPSGLGTFPWATFVINVVGSFLLGILFACVRDKPAIYVLLGTGFCGGFTTFSTFSVEAVQLIQRDRIDLAAAYVIGSVILGVFAAWAGYHLAVGLPNE